MNLPKEIEEMPNGPHRRDEIRRYKKLLKKKKGERMKLRNKKTGEIRELPDGFFCGDNLKKICEEWEDVPEEPKVKKHDFYYINENGGVLHYIPSDPEGEDETYIEYQKEIGNYFDTREEAEKAVEKLKAWKRLKDRNFRFNLNYSTGAATINHKDVIICNIEAYFDDKWEEDNMKAEEDLVLLLGGEE